MNALDAEGMNTSSILSQGPEVAMQGIEALDLSMIKLKLRDIEEGPGWSTEKCEAVEADYKRFLALKRAYSDREIVPNRDVDVFWHQHILDTEKYARDCEALFGAFLHHYPYFGMQGEDDYANLCAAFSEAQALYETHFGDTGVQSSATCRTKCKPVKCK